MANVAPVVAFGLPSDRLRTRLNAAVVQTELPQSIAMGSIMRYQELYGAALSLLTGVRMVKCCSTALLNLSDMTTMALSSCCAATAAGPPGH